MSKVDHISLVRITDRERFVAAHPFLFLFGQVMPVREPEQAASEFDEATSAGGPGRHSEVSPATLFVAPICKTIETFPSMISVGRTANNDIVIPDPEVSRMHAYFQQDIEHLALVDAGSQHGTFVDGQRLGPNVPMRVRADQTVRFAHRDLVVLTAQSCWDRVRLMLPPPREPLGE